MTNYTRSFDFALMVEIQPGVFIQDGLTIGKAENKPSRRRYGNAQRAWKPINRDKKIINGGNE